jgi:XTP/dITP diphosphohydrolase
MGSLPPVILATRNSGKVREFRSLLDSAGWSLLGLDEAGIRDDFAETGSSFAENARMKAVACSRVTELTVLADDSGLEVFALDGRPGIYSARYAGPGATDQERNRKLLGELAEAGADRAARFVCALALARIGALIAEASGECRGVIAQEPRGSNGFGYDPIFYFPELGRTYAELDEAEKNRWSHRSRAVRALLLLMPGLWLPPGT